MKTVKYKQGTRLSEYNINTLITDVELSEPSVQASLATKCIYAKPRDGVKWWKITNKIIKGFDKAKFEPLYYCKRCNWIENGGHRLAAAEKLKITVDVEIRSKCEYRNTIFGFRKRWKPLWRYKGMKIDIHIPTRKRPGMLDVLLKSIQTAMDEGIHVWVWFDTDKELQKFKQTYNWIDLYWLHLRVMNTQFMPPLFWNARLRETKADVFMYLCDDTEMDVECIREVKKAFKNKFPDFDGLVGIRQSNIPSSQSVPAAFGAMGLKFADRFPMRNVFCPEFRCFYIDEELGIYADSIGKFHYCTAATVVHHTPGADKVKPDDTNQWLRRNKQHDIEVNKERKRRGLLWGKDFELVNG